MPRFRHADRLRSETWRSEIGDMLRSEFQDVGIRDVEIGDSRPRDGKIRQIGDVIFRDRRCESLRSEIRGFEIGDPRFRGRRSEISRSEVQGHNMSRSKVRYRNRRSEITRSADLEIPRSANPDISRSREMGDPRPLLKVLLVFAFFAHFCAYFA